jgi:hypothetical protein
LIDREWAEKGLREVFGLEVNKLIKKKTATIRKARKAKKAKKARSEAPGPSGLLEGL